MSDRGMMKWAPYKSLVEQSECLEEMRYKKNKIEKPILSIDQKEKINAILAHYHGQTLLFEYFNDGYIYKISTTIKSIDKYRKVLILPEGEMPFSSIVNITDTGSCDLF